MYPLIRNRARLACLAAALAAAYSANAAHSADMANAADATQADHAAVAAQAATEGAPATATIAPYQPRFGRSRPVVAVIGQNSSPDSTTEISDFVVPYAVLTQSGTADALAVATRPGPLRMRRALQLEPHATIAQFDRRYPEGADYVIVPAVGDYKEPALLEWVRAQAAKGASIVSICDGAMVVAASGLMKGKLATAHWDTQALRFEQYSDVKWQTNVRYVADGKIISSAGISAALPTSIALVEAIAGRERAEAIARELGVKDWSTRHNSDVFLPKLGVNMMAFATSNFFNNWLHTEDSIGIPIATGVDDIALAFTADAYSRTGRSQAYAVAATRAPVRTRNGLMILPDRVAGARLDYTLPPVDGAAPARALDQAIAGITVRYGRLTAAGVALAFEYPLSEQ